MIQAYFNQIRALLDRYASASFVVDVSVTFDTRPGAQGYLSGHLTFSDGSTLYFREFLDSTKTGVEKVSYVYHYQDADCRLIFRYDNARHRAHSIFEHKHLENQVVEAPAPSLEMVLAEIILMKEWT